MTKLKRVRSSLDSLTSEHIELMQSVVDFFAEGGVFFDKTKSSKLSFDSYLIEMSIRYLGEDIKYCNKNQKISEENCDVWAEYDKKNLVGYGIVVKMSGEFKKNKNISCRFSIFPPDRVLFLNCGPFHD